MRRKLSMLAVAAVLALVARPASGQTRQIVVPLAAGWNNVAYVGPTRPVNAALAGIAGAYTSVWAWDGPAQRWRGMDPRLPAAGDFTDLERNKAYWIFMSAPRDLAMEAPAGGQNVQLVGGWNNFVYTGPEADVVTALAPAVRRFASVWRWDAARQTWDGYTPDAPEASDFSTLTPNRSYFLQLSGGPSLTLAPPAPTGRATPAPSPLVPVAATTTPTPARSPSCYDFRSYQPQIAEVQLAQNRVGLGIPLAGPEFRLKDLETQVDGNGRSVAAYVPPTLLKAIGWVESGWRQASIGTPRGSQGPTITSRSCAYGLMQVLSDMDIDGTPSPRQQRIGSDYLANIAAAAQLLTIKWNLAPEHMPVVMPRNPRAIEDWYYAVWAYHCYGDVCQALDIHNNPDDPALRWPRPMYNSPDQLASEGQFTATDYPYQELVYGVIANPPRVNGSLLWQALPVSLPPRGAIHFPNPQPFLAPTSTLDPTVDVGDG
jgi:hypothetical protein